MLLIFRLIERIWVVEAVKTKRMKTPLYRFHIFLLMPYFVIFSLMVRLSVGVCVSIYNIGV